MAVSKNFKMVSLDLEIHALIASKRLGQEAANHTLRRLLGMPPREDARRFNGSYKRMKKGKKK